MTAAETENRHRASKGLHQAAPDDILLRLLEAQRAAPDCLTSQLPALAHAGAAAARSLRAGGKLAYAGAGSAGLMALADCLELAGTFGIPPERTPMLFAGGAAALLHMKGAVEDDPALAEADLHRARLGPQDTVICVSASGTTPYTCAIAEGARAAGATVVGLANGAETALLHLADIPILLDTGAEMVAGSTRMAAGTAQKIALNMISTLMAVHLGHVHDGFMVNLTADNAKLRQRAAGIVAAIATTDTATAAAALAQSGGAVKPAALIAAGADPAEAARLLAAHRGHLAPALAELTDLRAAE